MRNVLKFAVFLSTFMLFGCQNLNTDLNEGEGNGVMCTMDLRAGLNFELISPAVGGKCEAKAFLSNETYEEELSGYAFDHPIEPSDGLCHYNFVGAWERAGEYDLRVELNDEVIADLPVSIEADICHVILKKVRVDLSAFADESE